MWVLLLLQSDSKYYINRESRLPTIHKKIEAKDHGQILSAHVCVHQCSDATLQVRCALWEQSTQHVN